jgi:N-acetylglutamate synthase-like GNAT family acetyltransferase
MSGQYSEEIKQVDYDKDQPKRCILRFDSKVQPQSNAVISIRKATKKDIPNMVALSYEKRRDYEKTQPQFWKHADGAEDAQTKWFEFLMFKDIGIFLVAEAQNKIVGFVRGKLENAPEVYDPGGLTLVIDDFCVETPDFWHIIGKQLLEEITAQAKQKGAFQVVVVSGYHDEPKRQFLKSQGLGVASEWFVGKIK